MPIIFTINPEDNYFTSSFKGLVTDNELLNSFKEFYGSEQWLPGMSELTDLSEGDASLITTDGMKMLAIYTEEMFKKNEVKFSKTAVYAPQDIAFGLSRMYDIFISDSPESFHILRDLDKAKRWLLDK